jgi:hypothetical protein
VTGIRGAMPRLAWTALLLAAFTGCEDYNYNPGAGREDVSLYLIVSEPTGDTLKPLLGVEWNTSQPPAGGGIGPLQQLRTMGVEAILPTGGSLKLSGLFPHPAADPDDPASYCFPEADSAYRAILAAGLDPMLSISTDEYVREYRDGSAPEVGDPLTRVLSLLVGHYADTGIWGAGAIDRVELTMGLSDSCTAEDAQAAASRLNSAVSALMEGYASVAVGGCGPGGTDVDSVVASAVRIIRGFSEAGTRPAFLSCRFETDNPLQYDRLGKELISVLDEEGFAGTELFLSGWGPSAHSRYGEAPSAAMLTASWMSLQDAGFAEAYLTATAEWALSADGTPATALWLFALWRECAEHPVRLGTCITMDGDQWSVQDSADRLWVLAGQDSTGEVAILLANLTEDTARVDISLYAPGLLAGLGDNVLRVEPLEGGLLRSPLDDGPLKILPDEALLVMASPECTGADTPGRRL